MSEDEAPVSRAIRAWRCLGPFDMDTTAVFRKAMVGGSTAVELFGMGDVMLVDEFEVEVLLDRLGSVEGGSCSLAITSEFVD